MRNILLTLFFTAAIVSSQAMDGRDTPVESILSGLLSSQFSGADDQNRGFSYFTKPYLKETKEMVRSITDSIFDQQKRELVARFRSDLEKIKIDANNELQTITANYLALSMQFEAARFEIDWEQFFIRKAEEDQKS